MRQAGLTLILIVLINVLVGCGGIDRGASQLVPADTEQMAKVTKAGETDIIERMVTNRRAYKRGMEQLVRHYTAAGNNMKLTWAQRELTKLNAVPQYNYIIEASLAGPGLKASTAIPEADSLYADALKTEKKAKGLMLIVDEDLLRVALDKYNKLIRKHPSSNKIADAAFQAGGIYEHFRDYSLAVLYYKRVYQWQPDTENSAMFRAALILDRHLRRREEALKLYQQALEDAKNTGRHTQWREFTERRIGKLTAAEKG